MVQGILKVRAPSVEVNVAPVTRGELHVTIDAEGKTRVQNRFTIAAPVAGELRRIDLKEGDQVSTGAIVAQIDPLPLDSQVAATQAQIRALRAELAGVETQRPKPAALNQAQTRIQAARAAHQQAQAQVTQAESALAQAERDRMAALYAAGAISQQEFETAQLAATTAQQDVAVALADIRAAQDALAVLTAERQDPDYLLAVYQAQIAALEADLNTVAADAQRTAIAAPSDGQVLRVREPSARHVTPGTPLLELGNANRLELVIDILSADAVRVSPGDPIQIQRWGGDDDLSATVRQVEPAAFTETSVLGVSEQRVNVTADFNETPPALGDGYRIEAKIVIWQSPDALQVPASALFRCNRAWCTFVVENGRAQQRQVELGPQSDFAAVVESGLTAGETVILYPGDQVASGVRVQAR